MKRNAYSLVEVLIAAAIIALGIAGAATLAHSMLLQQENSARVARAANLQEQIGVLYRLGLDAAAIVNVLPETVLFSGTPSTNEYLLEFFAATNAASGPSSMEVTNCRLIFNSGRQTSGALVFETNDIVLARPAIR